MREIKFKFMFQNTDSGETKSNVYSLNALIQGSFEKSDWINVGIYESTGLKDKNGVDIYEGDIVEITYDGEPATRHKVRWGNKYSTYPAFEFEPQLECECNGFSQIYESGNYEIYVIGNVYENPELLQEG